MARLKDGDTIVGFWSYARDDDVDSGGYLSELRTAIQGSIRSQLGIQAKNFSIFQDKEAISKGKQWMREIEAVSNKAHFFIPIISPTAIRSKQCLQEMELFLQREQALGRSDLIFPILYVPTPQLESPTSHAQTIVARIVNERQFDDWTKLTHLPLSDPVVKQKIKAFAGSIAAALEKSNEIERNPDQQGVDPKINNETLTGFGVSPGLPPKPPLPPVPPPGRTSWFTLACFAALFAAIIGVAGIYVPDVLLWRSSDANEYYKKCSWPCYFRERALEEIYSQSKAELSSAQSKITDLEENVSTSTSRVSELEKLVGSSRQTLDELSKQFLSDRSQYETQAASSNKKIVELEKQLRLYQDAAEESSRRLLDEGEKYKRDITRYQTELSQSVSKSQAEVQQREKQIQDIMVQLESANSEIAALKGRLIQEQRRNQELVESTLKNANDQQNQVVDGLNRKIKELETSLDTERKEAAKRQAMAVESAVQVKQQEIDTVQSTLTAESSALKAELQQFRAAVSKSEIEAQELLKQGSLCDELAAHPDDQENNPGVTGRKFSEIGKDAQDAIAACSYVVSSKESKPRYMYQLARALESSGNKNAAFDQYFKAAAAGHALANFSVGELLSKGDFPKLCSSERSQDSRKSLDHCALAAKPFYIRAASLGAGAANRVLGSWYLAEKDYIDCSGTTECAQKAIEQFRRAYNQHSPIAAWDIANWYNPSLKRGACDLGEQRCIQEAFAWYQRVENLVPYATVRIGEIYRQGPSTGLCTNSEDCKEKAKASFQKAQANGVEGATVALEQLNRDP